MSGPQQRISPKRKVPLKRKIDAFKRSKKMFVLIEVASRLSDESLRRKALSEIPAYRSRGKGGRHSKPGKTYRSTNKFL